MAFVSYDSEISVEDILTDALHVGKKLYLPKVIGEEIVFFRVRSLSELERGYKGIPEPITLDEPYILEKESFEKTLMLMPGVAFDSFCHRLGYGGGFYDRFLRDKEELRLRSIAVGFRCQMSDEKLPVGESDVSPYQVLCV